MVEAADSVSMPPAAHSPAAPGVTKPVSAFHRLLSELNPLQYLPVVGTIYRAVTGDTIPEAARLAGSAVVSFLMGGPIGLAFNVGATAVEKLAGIDPERVGQNLLASVGIGATQHSAPVQEVGSPEPRPVAWTTRQLEAYGVERNFAGEIRGGNMVGADVLNGLELARLSGGKVETTA